MRNELALVESAVTRHACQMRSAPAMNQTRHERSATRAVPLLGHITAFYKNI